MSRLLVIPAAAIILSASPADHSFIEGQEVSPRPPVLVRSQVKPGGPWKENATVTLGDLSGFSLTGKDPGSNRFGGRVDRKGKATGFFHVEKAGDRWWLVDPEGCFYYNRGVVSVRFGESDATRERGTKLFGGEKQWADSTVRLLRATGFNGLGAWSDDSITKEADPRIPYTIIWNFMSSYGKRRGGTYQRPGHTGYPGDCIFVFDPDFASHCDEHARRLGATKDDPYLLGHFTDNELPFPSDALDRYLRLERNEPGYRAAEQWLKERKSGFADTSLITDADREAFLELAAERYFGTTSRAIRKHDPNHLILGPRFHGKTLSQKAVFVAAGRHVDLISVNYYNSWTPRHERMQSWVDWSGRPILVTEWYVKGADAGLQNTSGAGWIVPTQNDRGLFYQNFTLSLLKFKGCVGWQWFRYMDNDPEASGADPSNTDANKGIVSVRFTPYTPLLDRMKELNLRAYRLLDFFDGGGK